MSEKIYLYCIVNCKDGSAKTNIMNDNLLSITYNDIMLIGEKSTKESLEVNLENLKRHERVVEMYMQDTVLPIRFNTFVDSIDTAKKYIKNNYNNIMQNFKFLNNRVEMGLKVFWNLDAIKGKIGFNKEETLEVYNGKDYIKKILSKHIFEERLRNEAQKIALYFRDKLESCIYDFREKLLLTEKMPLNAAYLVEKDKTETFINIIEDIKKENKDLVIISSGPWPPYNFIDIKSGSDI